MEESKSIDHIQANNIRMSGGGGVDGPPTMQLP